MKVHKYVIHNDYSAFCLQLFASHCSWRKLGKCLFNNWTVDEMSCLWADNKDKLSCVIVIVYTMLHAKKLQFFWCELMQFFWLQFVSGLYNYFPNCCLSQNRQQLSSRSRCRICNTQWLTIYYLQYSRPKPTNFVYLLTGRYVTLYILLCLVQDNFTTQCGKITILQWNCPHWEVKSSGNRQSKILKVPSCGEWV